MFHILNTNLEMKLLKDAREQTGEPACVYSVDERHCLLNAGKGEKKQK